MTEQLTMTCASKADLLADLDAHFTSLGLTLPTFAFSLPNHPSGVAEAAMDGGTRVLISVQEQPSPRPLAADVAIEGEYAWIWRERFHVPLAAAETTVIPATRGDLTVPATVRGTGTVRPQTPSHTFSGIPPLPPLEEGDSEQPAEWYQRTPGVEPASEIPQVGTIERIDDDRYVCETAQTDLGGVLVNYFSPDALNGGWRRVAAGGGLDPWSPGTYQLDAEVLYEPDGTEWINRRPNNSQAFDPPVSASGWMQIGPGSGPFPWKHVGNEGYPTPWQVTYNGRLWSNPSANNFWEPGVALWVDIGPAP